MKAIFLFLPALTAFAAFPYEGSFSFPHFVSFFDYEEASCVTEGGAWSDGACWFQEEDRVTVEPRENGFFVTVSTIGHNAHTCEFEGPAKEIAPGTLLATAETEILVRDENGEGDRFEPATCDLTLRYGNDGNLSVSVADRVTCHDLCGVNARLDIEQAIRK